MRESYWKECMFEDETIAEISKDGLMYRFLKDQVFHLLKDLPQDTLGWFFNDSRDRYCAEWSAGYKYILINPSKVNELFHYPVIL